MVPLFHSHIQHIQTWSSILHALQRDNEKCHPSFMLFSVTGEVRAGEENNLYIFVVSKCTKQMKLQNCRPRNITFDISKLIRFKCQ